MPNPFPRLAGSQLANLLTKAASLRCVLEVLVQGKRAPRLTRIRDLDITRNQLDIDPFGESDIDAMMEPGVSVVVSFGVEGLPHCFQTVCKSNTRGIHYHRLELPRFIEIIQRRASFRIEPPKTTAVSLQIRYSPDAPFVPADVINVSLGGMLAEDKETPSGPAADQGVAITLQFEKKPAIHLTGKVRHAAPLSQSGSGLRIGVQFDPLERRDEVVLSQIVMSWQREKLREQIET